MHVDRDELPRIIAGAKASGQPVERLPPGLARLAPLVYHQSYVLNLIKS
jgi:hypothetical protein